MTSTSIYTIKPTYLMIKQHPKTKLKYFCKTTNTNPLKYNGSGVEWTTHLKLYGNKNITTLWISEIFNADSIPLS